LCAGQVELDRPFLSGAFIMARLEFCCRKEFRNRNIVFATIPAAERICVQINCLELFPLKRLSKFYLSTKMKIAAALLVLPVAVQGFQVGRHQTSSVGPMFSSPQQRTSTVDYANGGLPNIAPDIGPMDLVHKEPDAENREIGKVPGNEQVRMSGELLGMDTGYKPKTDVMEESGAMARSDKPAMRSVPKIKCYQTSKKIIRYDFKGPFPKMATIDDLMNPKTFLIK
jgi:hypothetical protein